MKKTRIIVTFAVCFFLVAAIFYPAEACDPPGTDGSCKEPLTIMTRNLYLGADIFKVLEAAQNPDPNLDGLDVPIAVANLYKTVQYTNFCERAEALADEICMTRPHIIGLQEVSKWCTQTPGDAAYGGKRRARTVEYNYLRILRKALRSRGLRYKVAVTSGNRTNVELPMLTGFASDGNPTFDDLRMVDRDVILVRRDVAASNPAAAAYATNVSETIGGNELEFTRGWVAVDVDVCGETYRFVNTHLEIKSAPNSIFRVVQAAQMYELLTILSYETKPVILVGDINSSPEDVPGCYPSIEACAPGYEYYPPYMQAMAAGYLDAWDRLFSPMEGFTSASGFSETVDDPSDVLTERIDHILLRLNGQDDKWFAGITTGDNVFFMTPNGFWPSDHAGVVIKVLSNSADN